jgi:serine phosphatase RsbU (regulator of sigma subunit)
VEWNPGDVLLFYTDGATEALLGKGSTAGLEEVVLRLEPGLSGSEISQKLRSELEKIKEAGGLEDDVTLLTVSL